MISASDHPCSGGGGGKKSDLRLPAVYFGCLLRRENIEMNDGIFWNVIGIFISCFSEEYSSAKYNNLDPISDLVTKFIGISQYDRTMSLSTKNE